MTKNEEIQKEKELIDNYLLYRFIDNEDNSEKYKGINSVSVLENGDFVMFYRDLGGYLIDKDTFERKLLIPGVTGDCFTYLGNDEFILAGELNSTQISLGKFYNNRREYKTFQKIVNNNISACIRISNGDLINKILYDMRYRIYRKVNREEKNIEKTVYKLEEAFQIIKKTKVLEINDKEVLGIYFNYVTDKVELDVYETELYKITRSNKVNCVANNKKPIYFSAEMKRLNEDKLIVNGLTSNIYIFSINTLNIETIIKCKEEILGLQILPGIKKVLLLVKEKKILESFDFNLRELLFTSDNKNYYYYEYYFKCINIDEDTNNMEIEQKVKITKLMGELKNIFYYQPYINKGIITISGLSELSIYKNEFLEKNPSSN